MRLVIDLQGAQSDSRGRGIGRYSRSLALALAAEPGRHEVIIALNGGFRDATEALRDAFAPLLPQSQIRVWHGPGRQTAWLDEDHDRRRAAERIRGAFLAAQKPDLLLVTSMFEGFGDDAVTTLPHDMRGPPTVSICYDLIPLLRPDTYLASPVLRRWYYRALLQLQQSAGLLTISASSQAEIVASLGLAPDGVANILAGVERHFRPADDLDEPQAAVLARYGLHAGYVLCVGAVEQRKNLAGLIRAYALLPPALRRAHPLVATGWNDAHQLPPLRRAAAEAGLAEDELRLLTAFVPDGDLPALYRGSAVTVSPSLHEGFGLSVAEAMACGAAVICSNTSSLPEVIGWADATFDPLQPDRIADRLRAVLEQPGFRDELRRHGRARSRMFTWPRAAGRTWAALERFSPQHPWVHRAKPRLTVITPLADGLQSLAQLLVRLSRDYAVSVVSADPMPAEPMLAAAFPPYSPDWLVGRTPDRLLFLPGDDPHHLALTLRVLYAYAGIVVAGPRPVASVLAEAVGVTDGDLLYELLLHHYGWRAVIAARDGERDWVDRFPLEPVLRGRAVALLDGAPGMLTAEFIEDCYAVSPHAAAEACAAGLIDDGVALPEIARALAATFSEDRPRSLFLDVSTLAAFDANTGIQRVVREIVRQLGRADGIAARVEPVRSDGGSIVLARAFGRALFGLPTIADEPIPARFAPGDVFVCLDLNIHDIDGLANTLRTARASGARTVVVIYDLLPALQPQHFPETVQRAFPIWLHMISSVADGLLCISRTVADELLHWLSRNVPVRTHSLNIGWCHLGADFSPLVPAAPSGDSRPKLLMVGTVEPRKGHAEALDALEAIWRDGIDVDLVIVGGVGWHTEALQARLLGHAEAGQRLHWLQSATDAQLAALYGSSAALLMASEGEGFGLPIVEAARAGLPVIARDLAVFREICGEGAVYFRDGDLGRVIGQWLARRAEGGVADAGEIATLSWAEASSVLAKIVLDEAWYALWGEPERGLGLA